MVSKSQKKLIRSLQQKKYRKQQQLFVAEGDKVISELQAAGLQIHSFFTTKDILTEIPIDKIYEVTEKELKQLSFLTSPQQTLAVFHIPEIKQLIDYQQLILGLDDIRDPGNLGTIIRLCDWFGIKDLICSQQTVDCYNPKVVQASMGSITRVNIRYLDLEDFCVNCSNDISIYGTFMDGDNIYNEKFTKKGVVVMGNEANGISTKIEKLITKKIAIPRFGNLQKTESLNVATAAAITLSEFRR